eukprot:12325780-Alexandrium_andersonii.AAC.1
MKLHRTSEHNSTTNKLWSAVARALTRAGHWLAKMLSETPPFKPVTGVRSNNTKETLQEDTPNNMRTQEERWGQQ